MNSGINSRTEKLFQFFWTAFFILITVIAMIPILRVISVSFSSKDAYSPFVPLPALGSIQYGSLYQGAAERKLRTCIWLFHRTDAGFYGSEPSDDRAGGISALQERLKGRRPHHDPVCTDHVSESRHHP